MKQQQLDELEHDELIAGTLHSSESSVTLPGIITHTTARRLRISWWVLAAILVPRFDVESIVNLISVLT